MSGYYSLVFTDSDDLNDVVVQQSYLTASAVGYDSSRASQLGSDYTSVWISVRNFLPYDFSNNIVSVIATAISSVYGIEGFRGRLNVIV